jgi:transposase
MTSSFDTNDTKLSVFIGLDWGDRQHALCVLWPDGSREQVVLEHTPEAIASFIADIKRRANDQRILIALEQSQGALFNALVGFEGLELYPINPKQLARYRESVYPSGAKTDPKDAELLAEFLKNHQQKLARFTAADEDTRRLDEMSRLRRKLVDDRKTLFQKLQSTLKLYFPQLLAWCSATPQNGMFLAILRRWPSLKELSREHPKTLRKFLAEHGLKDAEAQSAWIKTVREATPLTEDQCLIGPRATYAQSLARQIAELNKSIAEFEKELEQATATHPDSALFRSLPGAGAIVTPRLIAAFGSDRSRYDSAEELQKKSGIAPITKKSGQSWLVFSRIACPKYLRQTFHEFAEYARRFSDWSGAFYRMKRSLGMSHHAAVRALAYKWIRIIFRMWQTRTPYSEAMYMEQLQSRNSPLLAYLTPTEQSQEKHP